MRKSRESTATPAQGRARENRNNQKRNRRRKAARKLAKASQETVPSQDSDSAAQASGIEDQSAARYRAVKSDSTKPQANAAGQCFAFFDLETNWLTVGGEAANSTGLSGYEDRPTRPAKKRQHTTTRSQDFVAKDLSGALPAALGSFIPTIATLSHRHPHWQRQLNFMDAAPTSAREDSAVVESDPVTTAADHGGSIETPATGQKRHQCFHDSPMTPTNVSMGRSPSTPLKEDMVRRDGMATPTGSQRSEAQDHDTIDLGTSHKPATHTAADARLMKDDVAACQLQSTDETAEAGRGGAVADSEVEPGELLIRSVPQKYALRQTYRRASQES